MMFEQDKWVPNENMHPVMNIWGRDWMTKDGEQHGTYYGYGSIPPDAMLKGIMWRFPAQPDPPPVMKIETPKLSFFARAKKRLYFFK